MIGDMRTSDVDEVPPGGTSPQDSREVTGAPARGGRFAVALRANWLFTVLPAFPGIALYRLNENIRSSLAPGFVGAGGIGVQLLTAMNLFDYQVVSLLLLMMTFVIVIAAERMSAVLRARLA